MFSVKRWGKVLGIIMAVFYLLLSLLALLPTLLISFMGIRNPLNIILGIVHLLLAVAVIVLASIPAKKLVLPPTPHMPRPLLPRHISACLNKGGQFYSCVNSLNAS